jgi:hypothetical protein
VFTCDDKWKNSHIKERKFSFYFFYRMGVTNPIPLKNNLVLEICKKIDIESQMFGFSFEFFFQVVLSTTVFYILFFAIK